MSGPNPEPARGAPVPTARNMAMDRSRQALRLATASLPHLAGLARLLRIKPTRRVEVAAIGPSGLLLINPDVFAGSPLGEAAFVLAHEIMHLALDTHGRIGTAKRLAGNIAHDYIINDMLREELGRDPPLGGLDMPGAREYSFEKLLAELMQNNGGNQRCWNASKKRRRSPGDPARTPISRALEEAGLVPPSPRDQLERLDPRLIAGDLLPGPREEEYEPEIPPALRQKLIEQVRREAAKAAALSQIKQQMDSASGDPAVVTEPQRGSAMMEAIRDAYAAPWELALQRWVDAVAPGERTYARPSRRGSMGTGLVRPGRQRHGWALHIVLDTSGSMVDVIPKVLGAISVFCEAANVTDVHLLQCDQEVTADDWIEPAQLSQYRIAGFGYSDMSPGLNKLAEDPDVRAVLVLTDGYIDIPANEPPYEVLWGVVGDYATSYNPPYGRVVPLPFEC